MADQKIIDQTPLEHAIMQMIRDKDFDGYLITRFDVKLVETLDSDIQTAALAYLNGRFFIRANEKFFNELNPKERVAVLKHEVAHFVNKHFARRNGRDPKLFNLAADCAINQAIENLPKDCIFPEEGWEKNESMEYYYEKYLEMAKKNGKRNSKGGKGKGKGNSKGGKDESGQGNQSGNNIPDLFDKLSDAPLNAGAEADSMAGEIIRETIKDRIEAGADLSKLRGLHAGSLEGYIDDLTAPPITDWRHVLARFASSLSDAQTHLTLKRPDRRELSPFGKRKEYLPSLVICVDTSGSVSDEMLSSFFSQISFLGMQLSEIEVVVADADVQDHFTYRKGLESKLRNAGKGRGGTDFDPAVQYINKNLSHCDGAVYLTDGWCPVPKTKCHIPMMWIVTESEEFQGRPRVMARPDRKRG